MPDITEIGAILPVALQINRIARKRVHAGIKSRKHGQRAEYEMTVVDHAVRMPRGSTIKGRISLLLESGADGVACVALGNRRQRGDKR